MAIDTTRTRQHLQDFAFRDLFVEELGWNRPRESRSASAVLDGTTYTWRYAAELGGVAVIEIEAESGIPDAKTRAAIHREITKLHHEKLLIFVVYDPDGAITDQARFREDFEGKGRCTVYVAR